MMHLTHAASPQTSEKSCSSLSKAAASKSSGRWTKEEHQRFVDGLKKFGKNWKQVEEYVGTRNGAQIRSHAQKFFNRLEREFNLKFEDLNLQSNKKKFEDTLRKISESSTSTSFTSTQQENRALDSKLSAKLQKNLSPIPEIPAQLDSMMQGSIQSATLSLSNSPKLNHFEYPTLARKPSRKMSEDIIHTKSYSLFDVIMAKIRTYNNSLTSPRLSDLVDISSSTRSSFDIVDEKPLQSSILKPVVRNESFANSSFRLHPRKMSEDNVLISLKLSQLRKPEDGNFSDMEYMTKKLKTN